MQWCRPLRSEVMYIRATKGMGMRSMVIIGLRKLMNIFTLPVMVTVMLMQFMFINRRIVHQVSWMNQMIQVVKCAIKIFTVGHGRGGSLMRLPGLGFRYRSRSGAYPMLMFAEGGIGIGIGIDIGIDIDGIE